jgi:branched-subunit amino acid aminotransferase/4-amino-4-deoxychorismate lyase
METTIFNAAFYRDSQWVTPATTSGCLGGVMRRWLLENGRIREEILRKNAISEGEWVLLFNGVQGCRIGRLYRSNC